MSTERHGILPASLGGHLGVDSEFESALHPCHISPSAAPSSRRDQHLGHTTPLILISHHSQLSQSY